MDGVTPRHLLEGHAASSKADMVKHWLREHRTWLLVVFLPTLLAAFYYFLIASSQYESEAHFTVRSVSPGASAASGLSQFLNMGGASSEQTQALTVSDYLTSHDAVDALRRNGLVARFRRPEIDLISRLRPADPTPETLLRYYRGQVEARMDADTGMIRLSVRAFRPDDSYAIIRSLLALGEQRVNALNQRSYADTLRMSQRQLAEAERDVTAIQERISNFRARKADIDPKGTGEAQLTLLVQLKQQLALSVSQLQGVGSTISKQSPQYQAMAARVSALQQQVNAAGARLTQGTSSISSGLGVYEELSMRQQFAAKRYEAAAAAVEKARDQALRQQLFIVRIVEPNLPVKSLYPHRIRIVATIFFGLLLAYAIGWLIAAGMREHAA